MAAASGVPPVIAAMIRGARRDFPTKDVLRSTSEMAISGSASWISSTSSRSVVFWRKPTFSSTQRRIWLDLREAS